MKVRKGVILVEICGEYLLVSGCEARNYCPYLLQINDTAAYIWKLLSLGNDKNDVINKAFQDFEFDSKEDARIAVSGFINQLVSKGYILEES